MRKIITMTAIGLSFTVNIYSQTPQWDAATSPNRLYVNPISTQVGIGTANPSASLDIEYDAGAVGIDINHTGGSPSPRILFQLRDSSRFAIGVDGTDAKRFKIATTAIDFSSFQSRFIIDSLGKVGVGDSTPVSLFTVAEGDKFQVDNNGDMVKIKNVTYSWPTTQGAASSVLTNNGSGTLSWAAPGSVSSAWTITGNAGTSPGTNFIGTTDNTDWVIKTNNTEQIRVKADGNIGIGTTSPQVRLNLSAASKIRIGLTSSSEYLTMGANDIQFNRDNISYISNTNTGSNSKLAFTTQGGSANIRMLIDASGNVGVGTTSPSAKLHVAGDVKANLGTTTGNQPNMFYDVNTKELLYEKNIQNIIFNEDSILKLRPVQFQRKNDIQHNTWDVGLIAEEVEKTMPDMVFYKYQVDTISVDTVNQVYVTQIDSSKKSIEGVLYHKLPIYLLAMLQEYDKKIAELDSVINNCCSRPQGIERKGEFDDESFLKHNTGETAINIRLETSHQVVLYQNEPNPFDNKTTIRYFTPENISKAVIVFYDEFGRELKMVEVTENGFGKVEIDTENLASGVYTYSLIINGKVVETRKMLKQK
jgi:hypothetical protein